MQLTPPPHVAQSTSATHRAMSLWSFKSWLSGLKNLKQSWLPALIWNIWNRVELTVSQQSWLSGLNLRATLTSQHWARDPTDWPWHIAARHFYLALLLRSFNVGRECKINVSACERYTMNCGTPSIQNAHIDLAEVARCTLLVSFSTDLACFCRSGRYISWTRA